MAISGGMKNMDSILIGNAFPLSLIRRPVRIEPVSVDELRAAASNTEIVSFWGHANTLAAAEAFSGLPLFPAVERPVIQLQESGLPSMVGQTFCECWIISPDYIGDFRPAVGEEVVSEKIKGWQILKITWE
jgi:hypothetical protein